MQDQARIRGNEARTRRTDDSHHGAVRERKRLLRCLIDELMEPSNDADRPAATCAGFLPEARARSMLVALDSRGDLP